MNARAMFLGAVTVLAMGCAGSTPPAATAATPTTAQWDAAATEELAAWNASMNDAWASGDLERIRGFIADDVFMTSFDVDMMGKPIAFHSKAEILAFAEQVFGEMKKMGATTKFHTRGVECRAVANFGTCVSQADVEVTAGGQTQTMSFNGTSVMHKNDNGWVGTHWHGSLAKLPEAPVAAPAPARAPAVAVALNAKELQWIAPPDAPPGLKVAVVTGDPSNSAFSALVEFPKGTSFPRHFHGADTFAYLIKGSLKITMADGRVLDLKPGAAGFVPGNAIHTTESKNGAVVYQYSSGADSTVMVDEQGKPLPPPVPAAAAPAASAPAAAPAPAPAVAPAK